MKTIFGCLIFLGGFLVGFSAATVGQTRAQDNYETILRNTIYAKEIHSYWADKGGFADSERVWTTSTLEQDWVLHYTALEEMLEGKPWTVEVPDIKHKNAEGEYDR